MSDGKVLVAKTTKKRIRDRSVVIITQQIASTTGVFLLAPINHVMKYEKQLSVHRYDGLDGSPFQLEKTEDKHVSACVFLSASFFFNF